MLVHFDEQQKKATLDVEHDYILSDLNEGDKYEKQCVGKDVLFHPEYGRFMIEATPLKPYNGELAEDYIYVEQNMQQRRKVMLEELGLEDQVVPLTITSFPTMGVEGFTTKQYDTNGPASHSLFLPDEVINRHVRFPTLTKNIRTRRGQKVAINVPIYPDIHTQPLDEIDVNIPKRKLFFEDSEPFLGAALPGHIYMDSMGFGMGCSCLQITMQAANIDECRYLYDSLLPLTPVLLALSAAAPIFKGTLADQDVRWNVISNAVDDRTPVERSVSPLEGHNDIGGVSEQRRSLLKPLRKSRYDSIDQYLGDYNRQSKSYNFFSEAYNDLPTEINENVYEELLAMDHFDKSLARHFAYLYVRDPLVLFSERAKPQDDQYEDDHFLNIQSTNWQTLRFKPPSAYLGDKQYRNKTPGWRVEFRPLEIQISDFENAAFSVFIALVSKSILKYKPNFYLPVSLIDQNMNTAHKRNSLLRNKFWFRNQNFHSKDLLNGNGVSHKDWKLLSIDEIINGNSSFIGLVPLVEKYIHSEPIFTKNQKYLNKLQHYLKLISKRAAGEIPTAASYIRNFVADHPAYKHNSIISQEINYDLLKKIQSIGEYTDHKAVLNFFGNELGTYILNLCHSS